MTILEGSHKINILCVGESISQAGYLIIFGTVIRYISTDHPSSLRYAVAG